MTDYERVRQFMLAFGQEVPKKPCFPSDAVCRLRAELHWEECLNELTIAISNRDLVGVFDSGLDGLFVVTGTLIAFGFSEVQIQRGFYEVHRSNMSKMWSSEEISEYEAGDKPHGKLSVVPGTIVRNRMRFVVTNQAGKIIKSPSYSPANLGPILEGGV